MKSYVSGVMFAALVAAVVAAPAVDAGEPMVRSEGSGAAVENPLEAVAPTAIAPVQLAGVQVFIDPKTGLVRTPTAEEAAALAAELQRQLGGSSGQAKALPAPVRLANGTLMAPVSLDLMNFSTAHIHADGTVSFDCVEGHEHGPATGAAAASGPEKE